MDKLKEFTIVNISINFINIFIGDEAAHEEAGDEDAVEADEEVAAGDEDQEEVEEDKEYDYEDEAGDADEAGEGQANNNEANEGEYDNGQEESEDEAYAGHGDTTAELCEDLADLISNRCLPRKRKSKLENMFEEHCSGMNQEGL